MTDKLELNQKTVQDLFISCLINDSDIIDGNVKCDYTLGEGSKGDVYAFKTLELLFRKKDIETLISMLPDLNVPHSIMDLYVDKNRKIWGKTGDAELLAILGVASGVLEYTCESEKWATLPFGMPIVKIVQKNEVKKPNGVQVVLGTEPNRD